MNYSVIIKTKKKTYKSKTNLGSSNENNTFDSYLDFINGYNNAKFSRYKESEILSNKYKTDSRNSNDYRDNRDSFLHIKCNLLNDEIFNNDLLSYSEEEIKYNNYNIEDFEKYLKAIKIQQSGNIIKHDIIFYLNILVENNYSIVLKEITKRILYKEKDIINNNDDIIENEHIFKEIIFIHITKNLKFIYLYAKICNDLNNNILNTLREQKNMKNNKERNLKFIINEECIAFLNNLKNNEIYRNNINKDNKNKIDIYDDCSKEKILGYVTFVYELIKLEVLKQQFGLYLVEEFFKIYNENYLYNIKLDIYLEGIIVLINKLGKIVFERNNIKFIGNINNYLDQNLSDIINNKNSKSNRVPDYLKYRIMNLITRRNNNWADTLSEKLGKEEKNINKNDDMINKIWNKEINIEDLNKSIIEEDLVNYITYFTEENSKGQINIKNNIEKSYNWKIIEELVNDKNFGLESIINYFILVCSNIINEENQIIISNDYIKNIIEYYANNLSTKERNSINNEMIKTFLKIDDWINKNENMYKILGNLLFILIDNKLFHIKYFNHYLKVEKQTQINLAIITRYCILSSGKFAKKYINDFKQTKLFINNEIFTKYIKEPLKDLLYYIQ